LTVRAQPSRMRSVGFLSPLASESVVDLVRAFRNGLGEAGFVDGRNVEIDYRYAENQFDRVPGLAAELVRRPVDVLVATGNGLTVRAAAAATKTIPVIFVTAGNPVELGVVASLSRPGGNVTGFANLNVDLGPKRLKLATDLKPSGKSIVALFGVNSSATPKDIDDLRVAAQAINRKLEIVHATGSIADADAIFERLAQGGVDAITTNPSALLYNIRAHLIELAARHALPTVFWDREHVEMGGLMSYGTSQADQFRKAGGYVARVLKGDRPADLPVQQPTKFELVINAKTAAALKLTIPPELLALADEVIE